MFFLLDLSDILSAKEEIHFLYYIIILQSEPFSLLVMLTNMTVNFVIRSQPDSDSEKDSERLLLPLKDYKRLL